MIRLDIFSDPVCPWCLIGKLELDRALESRSDHPFRIAWHPFRLNPQMPRGGMDRLEYLKMKPGAANAARALAERAAAMGLDLRPPTRQPDTSDAHRLMHWAGLEGEQGRVMSGLLRAHWQESRDISDPAELARIGGAAGLDQAMIARLLDSDADRDEIAAREAHARERGINAVPTFIVADRHAIGGAQPAHVWQGVIDELTDPA
ncbi:MAG: DsbA family oxidoreductase [Paracoccus sp. (in: a-proteobacteria)]|jgi:predicted DsbA family dithiol-disulfide isomerase|uniref:DsbA family oxidoreductase n=1 Tax=unclassified Paracoccus (in: a-proteobacteria) TaxID=2688777 RepID=UPI000C375B54|nr:MULTISPECIES: DsbA family oxidoreductase [unclassified Paracoccus (in: a-proteobacteria)]MAN55489.1 polyketide biosynthesis protein [Paracoccus sp. (in: a-proteobacteria)]MBA50287.1 polyketide biosynthesis protein [Paracoccus sp. (in: a-proteobacteria)]|tara:strand:- start:2187 stop:2801 length:615 start_codon:yes stop_codon:yes gene_type:complete